MASAAYPPGPFDGSVYDFWLSGNADESRLLSAFWSWIAYDGYLVPNPEHGRNMEWFRPCRSGPHDCHRERLIPQKSPMLILKMTVEPERVKASGIWGIDCRPYAVDCML